MNNRLTKLVIDAVELSVVEAFGGRDHGYVQQVKSIINHPLAIEAMNQYAKDYNVEQAIKYAKQATYENTLNLPTFGFDGPKSQYMFTKTHEHNLGDILSLDTRVIGIDLVDTALRNAVIEIVNDFLAVIPKNVIDFCLIDGVFNTQLDYIETHDYTFELMMIKKESEYNATAALTTLLVLINNYEDTLDYGYRGFKDALSLYYDEYMEVQFS